VKWQGDFSSTPHDGANVMPVYLAMSKPLKINAKGANWREISYKGKLLDINEIVILAKESGKYDGVIVANLSDKGVGMTTSKTATTFIAFSQTQIKSAIGNNRAFDVTNPDIRFSFGGRKALTADVYSLETAQRRLKNGVNPETVRKETGWFKGVDQQFRFEINDSDANFKSSFGAGMKIQTVGDLFSGAVFETLGDVVDHPALFAAYPSLAKTPIKLFDSASSPGFVASFSEEGILLSQQCSPAEALSALLHEIQHGIQQFEGFALGGTPAQFKSISSDDVAKLLRAELQIAKKAKAYLSCFASDWTDFGTPAQKKAVNRVKAARLAVKLFDETGVDPRFSTKEGQYRHLYGEVEARNVQTRQKFTDEERVLMSPYSTQDVLNRPIVVFNGKEMPNARVPMNSLFAVSAVAVNGSDSLREVQGCVLKGMHSGMVLSVSNGVVVQRVNRSGETVRHDVTRLSEPVQVGDVVDVSYRDGLGVISGLQRESLVER
jgi:hypothetical protein